MLKEEGDSFIYGIPNDNSHPIFIKKLDFAEFPSMMKRIPNMPLFKHFHLAKNSFVQFVCLYN